LSNFDIMTHYVVIIIAFSHFALAFFLQSINQNIYIATCRKQIRDARWQGLGRVFTVSTKQCQSVFNIRVKY